MAAFIADHKDRVFFTIQRFNYCKERLGRTKGWI